MWGLKNPKLEMDVLQRVEISSAAVASMISGVSSRGDSDGLLFGRVHRRITTQMRDDGDEQQIEDVAAVITGCCCTGSLMTFYDATGDVNRQSLQTLVGDRYKWGGDPLIGWLVARRKTSMRPSCREMAVTHSLVSMPPLPTKPGLIPYSASEDSSDSDVIARITAGISETEARLKNDLAPRLFFIVTDFQSEDPSHIDTHEYRAFDYCGEQGFRPINVLVRNIGRQPLPESSSDPYGGFLPVAAFPLVSDSDSWKGRCQEIMRDFQQEDQNLLQMFTDGMDLQELDAIVRHGGVRGVEALYLKCLARFEKLSREVRQSSAEVEQQEDRNAQLKASLGYF